MLSLVIKLPSREISLLVFGSELDLVLSGPVQLAIVLTALVCAGVDSIMRAHPRAAQRPLAYSATFWVLPGLLTIIGLRLLLDLPWWGYRLALVGVVGALLAIVVLAQYSAIDPGRANSLSGRLTLNGVAYLSALVLFLALYESHQRSVVSATGTLMVGSLVALELYRGATDSTWRTWLYALLTGALVAELTWALNYCSIGANLGGATLLLAFYLMTGLVQQHLWGRLTRRVVAEYGVIGLCAGAVLAGLRHWLG